MKITQFFDLSRLSGSEFVSKASQALFQVIQVVNGKLGLDNVDGQIIDVVTPASGSLAMALSHSLNRVPNYFVVIDKNATCDAWRTNISWTTNQIYLTFSANSVTLKVFVF